LNGRKLKRLTNVQSVNLMVVAQDKTKRVWIGFMVRLGIGMRGLKMSKYGFICCYPEELGLCGYLYILKGNKYFHGRRCGNYGDPVVGIKECDGLDYGKVKKCFYAELVNDKGCTRLSKIDWEILKEEMECGKGANKVLVKSDFDEDWFL
jgi:hypothetical protein